jgi:hypothetical protein
VSAPALPSSLSPSPSPSLDVAAAPPIHRTKRWQGDSAPDMHRCTAQWPWWPSFQATTWRRPAPPLATGASAPTRPPPVVPRVLLCSWKP